ncbi:MAG: hypothetical protein U0359_00870 [Byssovorax sp.]
MMDRDLASLRALLPGRRALGGALLLASSAALSASACGQSGVSSTTSAASTTASSTTTSGTGGASSTTGTGGSGGQGTTTTTTSSGTGGSAAGGGGAGGGSGGSGGAGGSAGWPTCDAKPAGVPAKTLHQIWQDDPSQPVQAWVPGVFVTAIAKSGCQAGVACQIFVQQSEQFADLAAGSQQALKVFISANTASHFVGLAVGDKVDLLGWAWRYNVDGQHELLLQVNLQLPGCAKKVGSGTPMPVAVTLGDLTVSAYEDTVGPLLVTVSSVSGKPQLPAETFGLWSTGMFSDAGVEEIVSLSPYALPGGVFSFDPANQGKTHDFSSVTGVFGLFIPPGNPPTKFKEIYPRAMSEAPIVKVH